MRLPKRRKGPRRRADEHTRAAVRLAVAFSVVALAVAIVGTIVALQAVAAADRRERNDISLSRSAAYRICERSVRTRAELHALAEVAYEYLGDQRFSERRVQQRLPIVTCAPNLRGRSALILEYPAQVRYVQRHLAGELPPLAERPPRPAGR